MLCFERLDDELSRYCQGSRAPAAPAAAGALAAPVAVALPTAPAQIVPGSSADVWQDSACARIRRLYADDAALHDTHCARRAG